MNIGVLGCGNISGIYLENLQKLSGLRVVAVADLDVAKVEAVTARYSHLRGHGHLDALLNDPEVEFVVNLTTPLAHEATCRAALQAGKHVYVEKPLGIRASESAALVALANERELLLGCAPDTCLGAGIQTARAYIESGLLGALVGVNAFMLCPGHESWHPAPAFYYELGGGPMFDMGPYYLTALVHLIGPIAEVKSLSRVTHSTRLITSQPLNGTVIPVETPTHVAALLQFANGAIGHITTSFDVQASTLPHIEIYGTEGSMLVPDPNGFGGEVLVKRRGQSEWQALDPVHSYHENWRGLGVSDMVSSLQHGERSRVDGLFAHHVVEVMEAAVQANGATLTPVYESPRSFSGSF